jgi:LPXTG-site transpeptidase (sortase) family protein
MGEMQKSRKVKIKPVLLSVSIGVVVIFLFYLIFMNFLADKEKEAALSLWEIQKETLREKNVPKDAADSSAEIAVGSEGVEEVSNSYIGSYSGSGRDSKVNYNELTAEDFFPLKISIPKIDLEQISYEGADPQTLKKGPGHIKETPLPGSVGRCTISGHRTTYGAPFKKIDRLENGDLIYLETIKGELFIYAVTGLEIVKPKDVYILEGTDKKELLLTSCYPEYSAAERIILISELINIYPLELASAENK